MEVKIMKISIKINIQKQRSRDQSTLELSKTHDPLLGHILKNY